MIGIAHLKAASGSLVLPVVATFAVQTFISVAVYCAPVMAPVVGPALGVPPAHVGYYIAVVLHRQHVRFGHRERLGGAPGPDTREPAGARALPWRARTRRKRIHPAGAPRRAVDRLGVWPHVASQLAHPGACVTAAPDLDRVLAQTDRGARGQRDCRRRRAGAGARRRLAGRSGCDRGCMSCARLCDRADAQPIRP